MKRKTYAVTVTKTLRLTQTYLIDAPTRRAAEDDALDLANEHNAETVDSDWKLVIIKEIK